MKVKLDLMIGGSCYHPHAITIKKGLWKIGEFPAIFALIVHPKLGNILFDTGYSERFFKETRSFPFRLYRLVTKVAIKENALNQLQDKGILSETIKYILISHFHADHIGGLKDFPKAKFFCLKKSYEKLKNKKKFSALIRGFLAGLLPDDFDDRVMDVEERVKVKLTNELYPFADAFDLFGDQSLLAVKLPGHAEGQMGVLVRNEDDKYVFLIGDASWSTEAYERNLLPSFLANIVIEDLATYKKTLFDLHSLHYHNPEILIIPSHCQKIGNAIRRNF